MEGNMAKEAVLQVRMDADLKNKVEELYKEMGTSFSEAVRIFARQSLNDNAMPFTVSKNVLLDKKRIIGIADGKYDIPDNIDIDNDEVLKMFEGM